MRAPSRRAGLSVLSVVGALDRNLVGHESGVVPNAPDEGGPPPALPRQAEEIYARLRREAVLHLGILQCSSDRAQLKALDDMLQKAKGHWASFNSDTAKDVLVSGDAAVGQIYDGFAAKARAEEPSIEYAFPREGYVVWMDNVVLLKDAPNRKNALLFMDFLLEPQNIAAVSNFARYVPGVSGAEKHLDPALATQPESNPPAGAGQGVFIEVCDQATQEVYDRIWTNLKK